MAFNLAADNGTRVGLIVWLAITAALAVLDLAALVSILRSPMTGRAKATWIFACLILQFFGPMTWFVWGRHQVTA